MKDPGSYGDCPGEGGFRTDGIPWKVSKVWVWLLSEAIMLPSVRPLLFPSERTLLSILYYLWAQQEQTLNV